MAVDSEEEIAERYLNIVGKICLFLVIPLVVLSILRLGQLNQLPIQGYYVPEESASICKLSSEEFSIRDEVLFFNDKTQEMSDNDGVCTVKMVNKIREDDCIGSNLYLIKWDCEGVGEKGDQSTIVNIYNTSDKILINKRKYIRCNR